MCVSIQPGITVTLLTLHILLPPPSTLPPALLQPSVPIEIPRGMNVRIDPAWHHCHARQIDRRLPLRNSDPRDPAAFDRQIRILQDMSLAVQQSRCADHHRLPIGQRGGKHHNPRAHHRDPAYRRCNLWVWTRDSPNVTNARLPAPGRTSRPRSPTSEPTNRSKPPVKPAART